MTVRKRGMIIKITTQAQRLIFETVAIRCLEINIGCVACNIAYLAYNIVFSICEMYILMKRALNIILYGHYIFLAIVPSGVNSYLVSG